jgi:malate dehydrogenase (quinone)
LGNLCNLNLIKYLVEQVTTIYDDKIDELRKFYLGIKSENWELLVADQRVQIIKNGEFEGGKPQIGTESVSSKAGSISCLLGASTSASAATYVLDSVSQKTFPALMNSENRNKLSKEIATMWKKELTEDKFNVRLIKSQKALKL